MFPASGLVVMFDAAGEMVWWHALDSNSIVSQARMSPDGTEVVYNVASEYTMSELREDWDLDALVTAMEALYGTGVTVEELRGLDQEGIVSEFVDDALDAYREREKEIEGLRADGVLE